MTVGERIEKFKVILPFVPENIINTLREKGFFTAPASAEHHGNYEGGLFDHSVSVAHTLEELTIRNALIWKRPESPLIVGMFHDICKMDKYKRKIIGWTGRGGCGKTPIYGEEYEYTDDTLYKGHGDKSVIVLSSLFSLTPEEAACIRYHMGAFTDRGEWNYYTRAIQEFPNVLWTHHADMIASHIKGV